MNRKEGWEDRLADLLKAALQRPFSWSEPVWDCGHFVSDVALALTGEDPGVEYRGQYNSQIGAMRLVREKTGGWMEAWANKAFGPPMENPLYAQRGDCVLVVTDEGETLGVQAGSHLAFIAPDGLRFLPVTAVQKAWRIG